MNYYRYVRQKMFFITTDHSAHMTKKLQERLLSHKERIELFFLHTYNPKLNPQEYLNQDVKPIYKSMNYDFGIDYQDIDF